MKKIIPSILSKQYTLPKSQHISNIVQTLSPAEKIFFWSLVVIFIISALSITSKVSQYILVETPSSGGSIVEGIVGSPRFINPLLSQSDADRDLSILLYSGLMKATPDGSLVYDLAKQHIVSEDGLIYTFMLRNDIFFHDGEPVTADDVVFTINMAQDQTLKSPKRASWDGVLVEKISDTEILFTLQRPYTPFLQNMTLGIIPYHIWGGAASEEFAFSKFNVEPVGSGPYKIKNIKRDTSGIPEYYDLVSFPKYALGEPYIKKMQIRFYSNENFLIDAFISGDIGSLNSISTNNLAFAKLNAKEEINIEQTPLPRTFGVFFNQNQAPVFAHIEVRSALDKALNKERIINEILGGYGTVIDSPIPPGILDEASIKEETDEESISRKKLAIDILERNNWTINRETGIWEKKTKEGVQVLKFSLATSNTPELKAAAGIIKEEWESIGAQVDLKIFEIGDLNQNVIRPRKYDALLFGEIVGRELDLYAFWHSSQMNDPGLNIALYANITVDSLLEDARVATEKKELIDTFTKFNKEISNDIPAVFIYAPDFIYIIPEEIGGVNLGLVTTPSERFLNVHDWFINTDSIWNFFITKRNSLIKN